MSTPTPTVSPTFSTNNPSTVLGELFGGFPSYVPSGTYGTETYPPFTFSPSSPPLYYPPDNVNEEVPVIRFVVYLFCTFIIVVFILYLNNYSRNPPPGPPTPNATPVTNEHDNAAQDQADLVKRMTPEERKEYVTNFLKTQKYVDNQDSAQIPAAPSSFRVTTSSSVLCDTDIDIESNLPDTADGGDNNNDTISTKIYPSCAICLDRFQSGEDICTAQNEDCPHEFHLECLFPWLLKSQDCPCCRRDYLSIGATPTNNATTTSS